MQHSLLRIFTIFVALIGVFARLSSQDIESLNRERKQQSEIKWNFSENLFRSGEIRRAFLEYKDFVLLYPESEKTALAYLRMGTILEEQEFYIRALSLYEEMAKLYPKKKPEFDERIQKLKQKLGLQPEQEQTEQVVNNDQETLQ